MSAMFDTLEAPARKGGMFDTLEPSARKGGMFDNLKAAPLPVLRGADVPEKYRKTGVKEWRPASVSDPDYQEYLAKGPAPRPIAPSGFAAFGAAGAPFAGTYTGRLPRGPQMGPVQPPPDRPLSIRADDPTLWQRMKRWVTPIEPMGGWDRSDRPFRTLAQFGTHIGADYLSGLGLNVPDILANKVTGADGLADAVDKITGYKPSSRDISASETAKFIGGLSTAGGISTGLVKKVAARQALKRILATGLTFGSRAVAENLADKVVKNEPFDWQGIHFEAGVGVLFGAGEVGLDKFLRFAARIKSLPPAAQKTAGQEARRIFAEYKKTGDRTAWDAFRAEYAGITPEGTERIRARTEGPPPVKDFGQHPLGKPIKPPPGVVLDAPKRPQTAQEPSKPAEGIQTTPQGEIAAQRGTEDLEEPAEAVRRTNYDKLPGVTQDDIASTLKEALFPNHPDLTSEELGQVIDAAGGELAIKQVDPKKLEAQFPAQHRATSEVAVKKFVERLAQGEKPPPVIVRGNEFLDGGHRVRAAIEAGETTIDAVDIQPLYELNWPELIDADVDLPYFQPPAPKQAKQGEVEAVEGKQAKQPSTKPKSGVAATPSTPPIKPVTPVSQPPTPKAEPPTEGEVEGKYSVGEEIPFGNQKATIKQVATNDKGEVGYVVAVNNAMNTIMSEREIDVAMSNKKSRQEAAQKAEQAKLTQQQRDDLKGFGEKLSAMELGRVKSTLLNKSIRYKDRVFRRKEFVEELSKDGYVATKKENKYAAYLPSDESYFLVTKAEHDYLAHLSKSLTPTPKAEGKKPPPGSRRRGFDRLTPLLVDEAIKTGMGIARGAASIVRGLPQITKFYTGRAAQTIEKLYGEDGKVMANGIREIVFASARRYSRQWADIEKSFKGLLHNDKIAVMKMGQGREVDPAQEKRLQPIADKMLEIMDRDMIEAFFVGYKRILGNKWRDIKGSGLWSPQVLNADGRRAMAELREKGKGSAHIKAFVEDMVAKGKAKTEDEALAKLVDWNNRRLKGTYGYFELARILLPESWVEFDPDRFLAHTVQKNAERIEAARLWGVKSDGEQLDFTKAKAIIEKISNRYGSDAGEALKKWVRTNFGLANDLPAFVTDTINTFNHYQTLVRLGYRIPSAIRNLTQGNVNMFTAPLSAHYTATKVVLLRRWNKAAKELYEQVRRSGAVVGQKEMAEVERGPAAEARIPKHSMKLFGAAEESDHYRAALIARFSAEKHIRDLASLQKGGPLNRILKHIKYVSLRPEAYLKERLKERTFTNAITDEQLDEILSRPLTLDDVDRIMHRASVDTQFIRNLATRSIPWRTSPWTRLVLKFKTFGIDQTRLLWDEAIKQAAKGTFAPLLKYLLFATLGGELYNILRDLIFGRDESLSFTLAKRPEKRTIQDIALKLVNDFIDGAGVGILTDMTWGVANFLKGPGGQSVMNVVDTLSNWQHPVMAFRKLVKQEVAVSRDIEALWARADATFINDQNKYFDYIRWRDRAFEWKRSVGKGVGGKTDIWTRAGRITKELLVGRPKYEKVLPYEYAARQVTAGDIEDAADYLAEHIRANPQWDNTKMRTSIETSMRNYAPFAGIAQKDVPVFLASFTPKDKMNGLQLQNQWIANYETAINRAFVKAGRPTTTTTTTTTRRRPSRPSRPSR